jgi:6-phosphogluconate dehydrogenase
MKLAVIGLGKMGSQITGLLVAGGHEAIGFDVQPDQISRAEALGAIPANSRQHIVEQFAGQQIVVWLMIPAESVDEELDRWLGLLPPNSILIDGGNSDYRQTVKRAKLATAKAMYLVDVGTSGGVLGRENGFSMMVGGHDGAFHSIEPLLQTLAKPNGGYGYFGQSGAGHYVKMVHNAIEYGMMESFAEGYQLLKEGPYHGLDLAAAGAVWETGSIIASSLNALVVRVLEKNPELEGITGVVAESGEARWALETAGELEIELPATQTAMDVRLASQSGRTNFATKLLAAMRNAFGGHPLNK